LCLSAGPAAAGMTPVAVAGFNRDVVIENTASGPPYGSYALEFNPGEGTAFYQQSLPGTSYGLPGSGSFTSALGDGTVFQFQPYTNKNALVLSSETGLTSGTLTLLAPNIFSRIAILANSASASSTSIGTVTLRFEDGPGFALQGVDRINISSGFTDGGPAGNPRFYQTTIDLAAALGAANKPLASLTFGKASSANATAIYAISGLPAAAVKLAAVTNVPATHIQAKTAALGGWVTATGGEAPAVTIYFGTTDGRTNALLWAGSIPLGLQGGAFAQTVSGLTPDTVYFYTAMAVNSAGTAWATPSQTFTTQAANSPSSFVAVVTHHNDNGRTGMNLSESRLDVTNVNANQFGLVFTRAVDDQIYAQPLVMTNVSIPGRGTHNLVLVTTVNDSVYAFDGDDASVTTPYWTVSFINAPNIVPPSNADMSAIGACGGNYHDFSGNMGIVGTPVIDPVAGTLYVVARTKENETQFIQRLHALDVSSGAERPNSPVIINATHSGNGDGSEGGVITFNPILANQRPGLALVDGVVYISWSSHCDNGPYHGWLIGYDQTTLERVVVYNDTPNGSQGGIWMSGQAPAADASGNLYLVTGNGTVDTSGGLLLIPGTTLAFAGGKQGVAYLVDRDNMGGLATSITLNDNIVQSFPVSSDQIHGGAVWWDGPGKSYGYIWPASVFLQQYVFDRVAGEFTLPALARSPTAAPGGQPAGYWRFRPRERTRAAALSGRFIS
jgi:hypothetical protein